MWIIERYRLKNLNWLKGSTLINNWWVTFSKWYATFSWTNQLSNSTVDNNILNTSRSYVCNFKLTWYGNFGWIFTIDSNSNNNFTWVATLWTWWWLRLKEWNWDTLINTDVLELNKWFQIILSYEKTTWVCSAWKNWKYLWSYSWIINHTILDSTLLIWMVDAYKMIGWVKEVELYNNSVWNAFAKNKYAFIKWFI